MQGCAYDAKQSQLVTHIPQALAAGARIFADCQVDGVELENGRAVGVRAQFLDRRSGKPSGRRLRVRARVVIVSAGGYNSAPLLLRSKIPNPSGQLGKNLQVNPCAQTFALFDEDVVMWRGLPAGVGVMTERLARRDTRRKISRRRLSHASQPDSARRAGGAVARLRTLAPRADGERASHRLVHRLGRRRRLGRGHARRRGRADLPLPHDAPTTACSCATRIRVEARVLLAAGAREVILPDPNATRVRDERELTRVDEIDHRPRSGAVPRAASRRHVPHGKRSRHQRGRLGRAGARGQEPLRVRSQRVSHRGLGRSVGDHHGLELRRGGEAAPVLVRSVDSDPAYESAVRSAQRYSPSALSRFNRNCISGACERSCEQRPAWRQRP